MAFVTIFSEGALLFVAAQTGFVDGPRVMAKMAIDAWFPRRFAALSKRLTMQNGIVLMGAQFPKSTLSAGKLVFDRERFHYRLLHNKTAFAVQRHLLWSGIPKVVLPIRVKI